MPLLCERQRCFQTLERVGVMPHGLIGLRKEDERLALFLGLSGLLVLPHGLRPIHGGLLEGATLE